MSFLSRLKKASKIAFGLEKLSGVTELVVPFGAAKTQALRLGGSAVALGKKAVPKVLSGLSSAAKKAGSFAVKRPLTTFITLPTAVGVVKASPKVRKIFKELTPSKSIKRGEQLGEIIEDPSKVEDIIPKGTPVKEAIKKGAIGAGLVGAGIGLGRAVLPKLKDKIRRKQPKEEELPLGAGTPFSSMTPTGLERQEILGEVTPIEEEKPAEAQPSPQIMPDIRNIIQIQNVL